jgi:putative spermidine/putrescine transport system ATP-binding protein
MLERVTKPCGSDSTLQNPLRDRADGRKSEAFLELEGITRRIGDLTILDHVSLSVEEGQFVSLLGPSGCGKTTLLRIASGLAPCEAGVVRLAGADITGVPAHRRNMGVVFQNYALFPHLSVAENVAFGLKAQRRDRAAISSIVTECLNMVQLSGFADRRISSLSGGQQQRVAVARALAVRPKLVLLDEPFSALDRKLRELMQIELRRLLRSVNMTAVFVTHDQDEALVMSDRIAVMNGGRIEDFSDPASIYSRPKSLFAFDFVGLSTRMAARVRAADGEMVTLDTNYGAIRAKAKFFPGTSVVVGVRPESMRLAADRSDSSNEDQNRLKLPLTDVVFQGSKRHLHFAAQEADRVVAEVNPTASESLETGSDFIVSWRIQDTLVFPA